MLRRLASPVVVAVTTAVLISATGVAGATAPETPNPGLAEQIAGAYLSPAGQEVRVQLAGLAENPALPTAASALLQSYGPAGSNELTAFQVNLLDALIAATANPVIVAAGLTGKPLSPAQQLQRQQLQIQLGNNPAVQAITNAGSRLMTSPQLPADITAVAASTSTSYATLTPPRTAGQGGSAAFDTTLRALAGMRTGAGFAGFAAQLTPVLRAPGLPAVLAQQAPLSVAAFLPPSSFAALQSSPLRTASLLGFLVGALEVLAGVAEIVVGAVLFPFDPIDGALEIAGGVYDVVTGVTDFAGNLDCDKDGDPGDPNDPWECAARNQPGSSVRIPANAVR
jgi:hypothetical protein